MCGIFGMIRRADATPEKASAVFVELGRLAIERGRDSAGFALVSNFTDDKVYWPTAKDARSKEIEVDGVTLIKDTVSFDDLWDDDKHLPALTGARVAIGHTRWATQGKRDALENASPLLTGSLIGTHNGDIDTFTVPGRRFLPKPVGSTDTEVLYQALADQRSHRKKITEILSKVEGRAALAWIDQRFPDRVYLSRAALSPLSIAWDAEGNLYWASNPEWFRKIDAMFDGAIGFKDITIVREGTLLTIDMASGAPVVADHRKFKPICRARDARLGDAVVWRGFDPADMATDKAQANHRVGKDYWTSPSRGSQTGTGKKGKGKKGKGAHQPALPHWDDALSTLPSQRFANPMFGQSRLDLESDEFEPAGMAAAQHIDEQDLANEVDEAVISWAEEGYSSQVVQELQDATSTAALEKLARKYWLTGLDAVTRFKDEVLSWWEAMEQEAEQQASGSQLTRK